MTSVPLDDDFDSRSEGTARSASTGTNEAKSAAFRACAAGLCVVPPSEDGTKRPFIAWKKYQGRRSTVDELKGWYANGLTGVGIVTGAVSGGLEMLEFEGRAVSEGTQRRFRELAEAAGLGALVDRIQNGYYERTPSGGVHLLYKVPTPLGSTRLASRPATPEELALDPHDKTKVLIETRGNGGYCIVAPSFGRVHPSGGAWLLQSGGFDAIATISDQERHELHRLAKTLDQIPVAPAASPRSAVDDTRPGDRYNADLQVQERVLDLLIRHSWTEVYRRDQTVYLRRPGKDRGVSATLGHAGPGVLHVFTTSTEFVAGAHAPFGVFGILEHRGDFGAAAKALTALENTAVNGAAPARPSARTSPSGEPDAQPPSHLTRQSLAAWYFAQMAGDRVRFDHGRRRWLLWSGHRWRPDEDGAVRRLWLDILATRYGQALGADERDRLRLLAEIRNAGAMNTAIAAGLDIASSMAPVATTADAWDPDPWALGCENGVVDLRTGRMRPGRPEDMVSRSTGVAYDTDAACPRWERFLAEVFAGDEELVAWYRLLVGASLVGVTQEVLAIHHGLGNNGKSVAVQTLRHVAGDYAVVIPIETLVNAKRSAGEATPDLMPLRGARIAFTSEPDQTAKLRGGVLKRLASIDRMTGRSLYGTTQTWEPTHTVQLGTNHLPAVDDATEGFWRRIALIPWPVRFRKPGAEGAGPPEDPNLALTLAAEAPGILAWAVGGAVAFAGGWTLHPFPRAVQMRTASYRAGEDRLRAFIDDRVVYERGASVRVGVLFAAYQNWCEAQDVPAIERLSQKRLAREFEERGHDVERVPDATNRTVFTRARLRVSTDPEHPGHSTPLAGTPHMKGRIEEDRKPRLDGPDAPRHTKPNPFPEAFRVVGDDPLAATQASQVHVADGGWRA